MAHTPIFTAMVLVSSFSVCSLVISSTSMAMPPLQAKAGEPILGLTPNQRVLFEVGKAAYSKPFTAAEGLGPAFNATSCATCHESPIGGWGGTTVQHFGRIESNGTFNFLEEFGGPVRQRLAIAGSCFEPQPAGATHLRERVTPSVLAFGLVEALTDAQLLANADPNDNNGDGVSGRVHMVQPLESAAGSPLRAGRFGWKAQIATVLSFSADAGRTEMGITNRVVGDETAPGGDEGALDGCDNIAEPEDSPRGNGLEFIDSITFFQRYLAPPPQSPKSGMTGEAIFNAIGCATCHTPSFTTPNAPTLEAALRNQTFRPYSDFLLHDMGDMENDGIGDGIPAGDAGRFEMKTPPLWNLRDRPSMLHDGSADDRDFANTVEFAILRHGGEGSNSRDAYNILSTSSRASVVSFLKSLGRIEFDVDGSGTIDANDYVELLSYLGRTDISPDEAGAVADIDADGFIDEDERLALAHLIGADSDCNQNGIDDSIEMTAGTSADADGNGIPDECDEATSCNHRVIRVRKQTNLAIPDNNLTGISSEITLPAFVVGRVVKVAVTVDLAHTWLSDVTIKLSNLSVTPTSEKTVLSGAVCSGCSDVDGDGISTGAKFAADLDGNYRFLKDIALPTPCSATTFIADGCTMSSCEDCLSLPSRAFRVTGTTQLSWFDGAIVGGVQQPTSGRVEGPWRLVVADKRPNDVGTLRSWTIDIVYLPDTFSAEEDCDLDGLSNSCDPDEDLDGVSDICEFRNGAGDCNGDGVIDDVEIFTGVEVDCDQNSVPDSCQPDTDNDGIIDACDGCPNNSNLIVAGACGCAPVVDTDGDGTPDCNDLCSADPLKTEPGACGCGVADTDSDSDGFANCNDGCPNDPSKSAPGLCGCGTPEADSDFDGTPNCNDGCPNDANKTAPGACGCGVSDVDSDMDGVANCVDNCPNASNANQADADSDGIGDACEGDAPADCDSDGMTDAAEIAAGAPDCNANGIPDICDVASTTLDCNSNDLVDSCEIAADPTRDCNLNGLLDSCDIATASSTDLNANARPDECEFIVGGSGFATLQAAIAAAPNGETILVAPGTFTGPFAVAGKSLTIRSLAGAASTILSGVGVTADAILTIEGIATNNTSIDGFTFTAGTAGHLFGVVRCGGGLFMLDTTADITNCRFESNSTNFGAGAYAFHYGGFITNCLFNNNSAAIDGGGLEIGASDSGWAVIDCTFTGNESDTHGGGAHIWSSSGSFTNCVFTANTAQLSGGAISRYLPGSTMMLLDGCTLQQNIAADGALASIDGVLCFDLLDTFMCRNSPANVAGCVTDLGGNTLSSDCDGDALCDAIEIADNPALDCNDDGVLDSCEIATGAVDCNANSVLDACEITADPSLDLNGNGQLDICEANNFRFVPSAQFPTIQSAVATVPAGGVTVFVGAGTYAINASTGGGIDLTGKKVILRSSVGATQTILDGTGLDDSILKIFPLTVAANLSSNGSVIEGFTFRNGTKGNVSTNRKGGAMFITGFNGAAIELTVRNCRFEDNASEFGGAIYAKDLLGSISLCDFNSNNTAPNGVGQDGGDGGSVQLFRGGWLFDGNVITGSSSTNAGGALHIVGALSATTECLLTNCSIAGNTAPIGSGVSWAQQGTLRVSAGGEHSVILKGNGGVACFGNNTFGQCTVPFNPGTTTLLSGVNQTAAGASHTMASKPNVAAGFAPVICWGDNAFGQCTVPPSLIGVSVGQIAAGARHSMALTGTGAVVCWGDNAAGQCTVPGSLGIIAAVAGGDAHSMALRSDATVTCWGSNSFGQSSVPAGLIGVVQIAAGSRHSVVLTSSGTIVAWGDNAAGQCTPPAGLVAPVQIAAGGAHTVARLGNDTVVCWGDNAAGQCTIPAGLGPVAGIAAGSSHTVVRLMTGTQVLVCWGLNTSGQCTVTGSGYTDTLGPPLHVTNTLLQGNTGTSSAAFHTNGPLCFLLSNLILCDNAPANFFGCYEDLGDVRFSQDCDGDGVCDAEEILNGDEADTNGNFIPDDCELDPADLNGDGFINAADLSLLLSMWGSAGPDGDINGDGAINAADLALMLSVWGN